MAGGKNAIGNLLGKVDANGALVVALDGGTASATTFVGPAADNTAAPPFTFAGDLNTGIASAAADTVNVVTGGTSRLAVSTTAVTSTVTMVAADNTGFMSLTRGGFRPGTSGNGLHSLIDNDGHGIGINVDTDGLLLVKTTAQGAGGGIGFAAVALSGTAPTIGSGFGTSPSIAASNGSAAFTVNVGTGGSASAGVITMPTAANGWVCHVENITQTAANRANVRTVQTASTTTSITVQNQTISTGAAVAWTASDVLRVIAFAY